MQFSSYFIVVSQSALVVIANASALDDDNDAPTGKAIASMQALTQMHKVFPDPAAGTSTGPSAKLVSK